MKPIITFADFQKLDLKVATILRVERLSGSEKMLKIEVDLGQEKRQILATLGKDYSPEELEGKQLVVLTNLEPKKMMGEMSNGMLLAAENEEGAVIISPEIKLAPGTTVR